MVKKRYLVVPIILVVLSLVLGACTTATPSASTAAPAQPTQAGQEPAPTTPAGPAPTTPPIEPTAPPEPASKVGGTFVFGVTAEPDTLDAHKTGTAISDTIMYFLGGSLVLVDPEGKYIPYLAESWEASEDGLVWDFHLKEGIKFHDGTPLTAEDYAWTYQRALAPETASTSTGPSLGSVASVEAVDELTLRITLAEPYFPILQGLSDPGYMMPMPKAAVEAAGDDWGRNPISVGPYKLKEWQTGTRVVLERNPDYTWGPEFGSGGPYNIEFLEFRVIPELATIQAGLESGDLDYAAIETINLPIFEGNPDFIIHEIQQAGLFPYVTLNVTKPPFDDVVVRKAFNMVVDRQAMLNILTQGKAIPQMGPLSPSQIGYWPGVEEIGYTKDVEEAKALLTEAGYAPGSDGILAKGGEKLALTLYTLAVESWVKSAEVLKEQFKEIGVELEIVQEDQGVLLPRVMGADYEMSMMGITYPEADILFLMFHSSNIGGLNLSQLTDPVMDEMLSKTRTETDIDARQEAVNEVQKYVVENAFVIPLYVPNHFFVVNSRVKDYQFSPVTGVLLDNAYIEE